MVKVRAGMESGMRRIPLYKLGYLLVLNNFLRIHGRDASSGIFGACGAPRDQPQIDPNYM